MTAIELQLAICRKYGVDHCPAQVNLKAGVSTNVRDGIFPLNDLRHPPAGDTTGWYIWAGDELTADPEFFLPLHLEHLATWCPEVLPYLGLPPGWRFLIAPGYEDVWYDAELLRIKPA